MQKLLVIGYVWPEPKSSAAGARMMQLLEFFKAENFEIIFATTAKQTPVSIDLEDLGITSSNILLNDPSFDIFVRDLAPDVVLYDRFMMEEQFGWRISEICPNALTLLDTEDLHFLRKYRQEVQKRNPEIGMLQSDLAYREIASIYRCDLSLIISEYELNLLQEQFGVPKKLLTYLPFMIKIPSEEEKEALPGFEQRENFVSIGNFRHPPNWDAVRYLKSDIWPAIRKKLPQARLNIYGAYASEKVYQLNDPKTGFLVHGRAESATAEIKKARILLAPLRFGAGLKGKFIDAMKTGTPVVSTSLGAEGMKDEVLWNGVIADDLAEFATAAVDLYTNKELWQQASRDGFEILGKKFSASLHHNRFRNILDLVTKDLVQHRNSNFTGRMLRHQSMTATKYLSKYIELKNRQEGENI